MHASPEGTAVGNEILFELTRVWNNQHAHEFVQCRVTACRKERSWCYTDPWKKPPNIQKCPNRPSRKIPVTRRKILFLQRPHELLAWSIMLTIFLCSCGSRCCASAVLQLTMPIWYMQCFLFGLMLSCDLWLILSEWWSGTCLSSGRNDERCKIQVYACSRFCVSRHLGS